MQVDLLPTPRWVRLLPVTAGITALVLGIAVAIGWAIRNPVLTQVNPSLPAMKLNTALCIMACGVAMILRARRRAPAWAAVLSALVLVVALATLLEWVFGVSLGIDQLLVSDPQHASAPGRPSPNTAMVLALLASALMTLDSPKQRLNGALVIGTAAIAQLTAVGYLYDASALRAVTSAAACRCRGSWPCSFSPQD